MNLHIRFARLSWKGDLLNVAVAKTGTAVVAVVAACNTWRRVICLYGRRGRTVHVISTLKMTNE